MGLRAFFQKLFSNQRGAMQTATKTRTATSTRVKVAVTIGMIGLVAAAAYGFAFAPGAGIRSITTKSKLPKPEAIDSVCRFTVISEPERVTASTEYILSGSGDGTGAANEVFTFRIKANPGCSKTIQSVGFTVTSNIEAALPRDRAVTFSLHAKNPFDSNRISNLIQIPAPDSYGYQNMSATSTFSIEPGKGEFTTTVYGYFTMPIKATLGYWGLPSGGSRHLWIQTRIDEVLFNDGTRASITALPIRAEF